MQISLFFEVETFRHIRTEYSYTVSRFVFLDKNLRGSNEIK